MNEKLKFNLNRLKKDFEDVIDELVEEIKVLTYKLEDSISLERYEDVCEQLEGKEEELEKAEEKIADLEDKIEELEGIINTSTGE